MPPDPSAEYERVSEKYAPIGVSEVALVVLLFVILLVASRFFHVGWYFFAGMVGGVIVWEVTKFRLRRNARHFAEASGRDRP